MICKFRKKFQENIYNLFKNILPLRCFWTGSSHFKERCQSDRMDRTRNPAYGLYRTVGLNPTLSAIKQVRTRYKPTVRCPCFFAGLNPTLSANKGVNQAVTRFTPIFTPKNQGWVYFFDFLIQMLAKKEEWASFSFRQHLF